MDDKSRKSIGRIEIIREGNWLGKARRTFFISNRCHELLHELTLELGLSHSGIVELAVRSYYQQIVGPVPKIPLLSRRTGAK